MVQHDVCDNINPCGDQVFKFQAKFELNNANIIYLWLLNNLERGTFDACITNDNLSRDNIYLKVKFKTANDYTLTILTWDQL